MTFIRITPADIFEDVQNEMKAMMNELRGRDHRFYNDGELDYWKPRVDIRESENELMFIMELPGVSKEDVHIYFEDGYLKVEGERKAEEQTNGVQYLRRERSYGKFARRFKINTRIDTDGIEARFDNGLLMIRLPKAAEEKPHKIEIKTSK
ncbi:MAG: Hsp20/alpha crystallin family protein [Calditrichaeota bacterium]|nr:MAG: Hsp20/alpha crystallin family protein [Calditrichota bacterium]